MTKLTWRYRLTDLLQNSEFDFMPDDFSVRVEPDAVTFGTPDRPVAWYVAEDGKTKILKWANGDRGASFGVSLSGNYVKAMNQMTMLRRWLRRIIEAEEDPFNNRPVYLEVMNEQHTDPTLHRLKFAAVDESRALIGPVQDGGGDPVHGALVTLTMYPTGTTRRSIPVSTLLANGDFQHWNGTYTVPDDWTAVATGTMARVSDRALVGPYSCHLTSATALDGVQSDASNVPAHHIGIFQVWLHIPDQSTWRVQICSDPTGGLESVTGITANNLADKAVMTTNDDHGNLWGLIQVAQQDTQLNTDAAMYGRVQCTSGAGECYLDGAVLKNVEGINLIPYPGMDVNTNFVWIDGWAVSGYLESGEADGHCVVGVDNTNRFRGGGGATITFDSATSSAGYYRCLTVAPREQDQVFTARMWLRFAGSYPVDLRLSLLDGAGNTIDTRTTNSTDVASNADASATGADAATWYMFKLGGANFSNKYARGVYLKLSPTSTGGTNMNVFLDQVHLYRGTGPAIGNYAQIFSPNLEGTASGYDGTLVKNSPGYNYVRFFNLPGDQNALVDMRGRTFITMASAPDPAQMWMNKMEERRYPDIDLEIEAENWASNSATNGSWNMSYSAGATASGSTAARFTASGGVGSGSIAYVIRPHPLAYPAGNLLRWAAAERRVKVRARTSDISNLTLQFKLNTNGGQTITSWQSAEALFTANNTWEELDLGALFMSYQDLAEHFYSANVQLEVHFAGLVNTKTLDIDYVSFPAVPKGGYGLYYFPTFGYPDTWLSIANEERLIRATEGSTAWAVGKGVFEMPPGNISTKVAFSLMQNTNKHTLTDYMFLTAQVWPQTTGLLGTI